MDDRRRYRSQEEKLSTPTTIHECYWQALGAAMIHGHRASLEMWQRVARRFAAMTGEPLALVDHKGRPI